MLKPEQIAHINVLNWFRHDFPELKEDFHHFANERECSQAQGATLKRMGVMAGVADFHLAYPVDRFHGLWLELKVGKNKLTGPQERFLKQKRLRGYVAEEARGFEEAQELILNYLRDYIITRTDIIRKNGI